MNMLMKRTARRALTLMMPLAVALCSTAALAQSAAPVPVLRKAPPAWLGMLVMFLLLAVVMAVSLMPSKRSHQD